MIKPIREDFRGELDPTLFRLEIGSGKIEQGDALRMVLGPTEGKRYSDSQLYNYEGMKRRDYPSHPPLRMTVRVWASHSADQLLGTAGFGFWNQPMMPDELQLRLPRAVWFFFGSRPSDMAFSQGVPGYC